MSERFALIGAAGFVAPRHLRAIKEVGGTLCAALDPHDSVGVLDSYFPDAAFFTEVERFDRYLDKLRRNGDGVDYVSICSPNYLHSAHIRLALRSGCHAICEKPMVVNESNIELLQILEQESGKRVYNIHQLRLLPQLGELRSRLDRKKEHDVRISYVAPRGRWYRHSWKADPSKSGGLLHNIGVHLFDIVQWVFGPARPHSFAVHVREWHTVSGVLRLGSARVQWLLSCAVRSESMMGERVFEVDGERIDLSPMSSELHTLSYREILAGRGMGIEDVRPTLDLLGVLRDAPVRERGGDEPT